MKLDPQLLFSANPLPSDAAALNATLNAHGQYSPFQFVLRLSAVVHRRLAAMQGGSLKSSEAGWEGAQAFSTYLHETIHWWQHVGSTYGLMASLSYPAQAHANYTHLKELLAQDGFKKPIRRLIEILPGPGGPETLSGLANRIVNNHYDLGAFRKLTYNQLVALATIEDPLFESLGHAFQIAYANNNLILAATADPDFHAIPHPRDWEAPFRALREAKTEAGFYYGSNVELWPLGAHEILEGQACFSQLQYLAFASGGRLKWDDVRSLGMLHGVYEKAFQVFLEASELNWPPTIDHPTVALFLLVCDLSINSGSGFPHPIFPHYQSFITDTDPGARFTMMARLIRLKAPHLTTAIRNYSRDEYKIVSRELANLMVIDSPLAIAQTCIKWTEKVPSIAALMKEYETFDYEPINQPVRVLFSHFLAFMKDKFERPEFFCWPGAWMAGSLVDERAAVLFDRHGALYVDKEDDDGIFPRLVPGRDEKLIHATFETFYAVNVTYDLTDQWIARAGPFTYDYHWLNPAGSATEMKGFADGAFERAYGARPDSATLL